ncbi:MAG: RNA methyltransferase [Hyphomicrobiales bacterium]|nr:MAG: RNA methyltransferase [Hyphomicrobiales bacterium]
MSDAKTSPVRPGVVKTVTSLANPTVKDIRSLQQRKFRQQTGRFVAEGLKLVTDAVEAGWPIEIFVHAEKIGTQDAVAQTAAKVKARGGLILQVSEAVLSKMTHRDNPQMVIGVFRQRLKKLADIDASGATVWVALENIKDPGNLGTVIRTVDSVGASGVILIGDTVDPFSIETVRATMGSIFAVPVVKASVEEFLAWKDTFPGPVIGTHLAGAVDYRTIDYPEPMILLMGNEQSGLPQRIADSCDRLVKIPMAGRADSLNLAVSTGIMLYEARRSRLVL